MFLQTGKKKVLALAIASPIAALAVFNMCAPISAYAHATCVYANQSYSSGASVGCQYTEGGIVKNGTQTCGEDGSWGKCS
jgi:hypothetical protein